MPESTKTDSALPAAFAGVPFIEPERAARNLASIERCVSPDIAATLPNLLAESPDPDSALNSFERLCTSAGRPVLRLLERQRFLIHYALAVFGYSQFLADTLIQNLDLLQRLARDKRLDQSYSAEDYREAFARLRATAVEPDVSLELARFKRREYIRIMLRDVLGIATLADTTSEISALADVLIAEALQAARQNVRKRYAVKGRTDAGFEPPVSVLALGKLGGREVNYSSDVDLLFLYHDGDAPEGVISNREFFVRLAQEVTEILSRITREGPVFRIDLRLRPLGREGEPAVGLHQALDYYAHVAHDWELQAMIKARHCAGDSELTREFLRGIEPYIYKEKLNFPAIETALASLQKIGERRRRGRATSSSIDVKLDRGGIRDIEFLVQCLQRVYGGSEPWLRSGGTLFSLQKLHDKLHISGKSFHELSTAYAFLRKLEHRLQLRRGQQTHRLPTSRSDLTILWRAIGGEADNPDAAAAVVALVQRRMTAVGEIYNRIIHQQQWQQEQAAGDSEFRLQSTLMEVAGDHSSQQMLSRLATDAPELYKVAVRHDVSPVARRNLQRFLSSAFTSSERYAVVAAHAQGLERALDVFESSEYLTDVLVRHPEEIVTLEEAARRQTQSSEQLFQGGDQNSAEEVANRSDAHPPDPDVELRGDLHINDPFIRYLARPEVTFTEKLALLRQHCRRRVFASAVADLMLLRPVFDSLAETTAAAEHAIAAACVIAEVGDELAVLGLGRLGTREFDLGSDADLLFVCDEGTDLRHATRTAERIVETLSAYTRDGTVFSVDSRLRPRGMEGELVVTPSQLSAYFKSDALAWEALTYTKLRRVGGSGAVGEAAMAAVRREIRRFVTRDGFAAEIRAMRAKQERSERGEANFKTASGGFYDIDFIAGYLTVLKGNGIQQGHIRRTLHQLATQGALAEADRVVLDAAAELVRITEHVVRLVLGRARKSLPASAHARVTTERLTARIANREFPDGLEAELSKTFAQVREVYERLVR